MGVTITNIYDNKNAALERKCKNLQLFNRKPLYSQLPITAVMELEIVYVLFKSGSLTVTQLAKQLDLSVSRTSRKIKLALRQNLITHEKKWKEVLIQLNFNNNIVQNFINFINTFEKHSSSNPTELFIPESKVKILNSLKTSPKTFEQLQETTKYSERQLYEILASFRNNDLNLIVTSGKKTKIYSLNPKSPITTSLIQLLNAFELEPKLKGQKESKIKVPVPIPERILIYLTKFLKHEDDAEVTSEITQAGIGDALGIPRKHIPRALRSLINRGHISEKHAHVRSSIRKYKAYFLTSSGSAYAMQLKTELENFEILVEATKGQLKKMKVLEILKAIGAGIELDDIVAYISKTGIFDYKKIKEDILVKRQKYIDYSDKMPDLKYFFGRDRELHEISNWFDSNSYKLLILKGIAGVGKTTLLTKFVTNYKRKTNIFWYRFHDWSSLKNILTQISEFLDNIGKSLLKKYIRAKETIDLNEISILLEAQLKTTKALLIFDDSHKIKDSEIYQFLEMLQNSLEVTKNIKIIISGRELKPFYDRRDVVVKEKVKELSIDGLDKQSSIKLMEHKGLDPSEFEKIYKLTDGHPLSLELIEKVNGIDKANLQKFIQDEILKRLSTDEVKLLEIASVFRFPVPVQAYYAVLRITDGKERVPIGLIGIFNEESGPDLFKHDTIESLVAKSLIQVSAGLYDLHDIVREFFYYRLPEDLKQDYHTKAAEYYLQNISELSTVEALYHLLKAASHEKAAELVIQVGKKLITTGYLNEISSILNEFNETLVQSKYWIKILIFKGEVCIIRGEYTTAINYYQLSLALCEKSQDYVNIIETYSKLGLISERQSQWDSGIQHFTKSLEISEQIKYLKGKCDGFLGLGRIYALKGDSDNAIIFFNNALVESRKLNDISNESKCYIGLGNTYWEKGEYDKAIEMYNKSLKISQDLGEIYEVRRVFHNIGNAYWFIGEYKKSVEFLNKELKTAEEIGDVRGTAHARNSLAWVYLHTGNLNDALQYCEKALSIFKKLGEDFEVANTTETYACIFWKKNDWDKGAELFNRSIELFKKIGHFGNALGNAYFDLGLMLKDKGDFRDASQKFNEALKIFKKLDNKAMIEKIENELKAIDN